jgi:hypothetical protein
VGSNIEEDTKVGCTLMVGMECFPSTLLDPFVVMMAKHEGTLMKNWSSYAEPAKVVFQPNYWMDALIAKKYLDWVVVVSRKDNWAGVESCRSSYFCGSCAVCRISWYHH